MGSCVLVLMDHFIWFTYFSQRTHRARQSVRNFGSADWRPLAASETQMLTFMDIATFFGVCVWLIPLFLFLSLSANDNALPVSLSTRISPAPYRVPNSPSCMRPQTTPALLWLFRPREALPRTRRPISSACNRVLLWLLAPLLDPLHFSNISFTQSRRCSPDSGVVRNYEKGMTLMVSSPLYDKKHHKEALILALVHRLLP